MSALVTLAVGLVGCVGPVEEDIDTVPAETLAEDDAAEEAAAGSADTRRDPATEAEPRGAPETDPGGVWETPEEATSDATESDGWTVINVVDGDTLDVRASDGTEERVRVVGIDAPEAGDCGFGDASDALADLVMGREATLTAGAPDDRDRYDRLLRYVDVGSTDAGLELIELGLAIARYDSRDGYGAHPREHAYVTADEATENIACEGADPEPAGDATVSFENCTAAREAGAAPVRRGDPGYGSHLDGDGDGAGCE